MTKPVKVCQLYFLFDPRKSLPFYVGIGKPGRSKVHLSQARNASYVKLVDLKKITIMKLLHEGLTPVDKIIHDNLSKAEAKRLEKQYIKQYGRIDLGTGILTNRTSGGEWINDCPRTSEWKQKMSASLKIAQNRADVKAKKSARLKGLKRSDKARQNIRNAQLVKAVREKNSKSKQGANNPSARRCSFQGREYKSVIEIVQETGLSRYFVKKDPTFRFL